MIDRIETLAADTLYDRGPFEDIRFVIKDAVEADMMTLVGDCQIAASTSSALSRVPLPFRSATASASAGVVGERHG